MKTPVVKSLFVRVTDLRGFRLNSSKFLTILTGKTVFYSVQYNNGWLAASNLFYVFTQSIKVYHIFYRENAKYLQFDWFKQCAYL